MLSIFLAGDRDIKLFEFISGQVLLIHPPPLSFRLKIFEFLVVSSVLMRLTMNGFYKKFGSLINNVYELSYYLKLYALSRCFLIQMSGSVETEIEHTYQSGYASLLGSTAALKNR